MTGYVIRRDGEDVTTVDRTSYTDDDVDDGTTYRYQVVAVDEGDQESQPSDAVRETWDPAPAAPKGLTATEKDDAIALRWKGNDEPDLRSYRVYRNGERIKTVDEPAYDDTAVTDGETYRYSVEAVDRAGQDSKRSERVEGAYDPAPAKPTGLTAKVHGYHVVSLDWEDNSEPDIDGYKVYRNGEFLRHVVWSKYTEFRVHRDATYTVSAVDESGQESDQTQPVEADLPPAAPTGLDAVAVDARAAIRLTWKPSVDAEAYLVIRDSKDGRAVERVDSTRYVDRDAAEDVPYTYRIKAVDVSGNRSAPSSPDTESWDDTPSMPTGLDWDLRGTVLRLSWDRNPEADIRYYRVWLDHESLGRTPRTWRRQNGHNGTYTHTLRVVAVDRAGNRSEPAYLTFTHSEDESTRALLLDTGPSGDSEGRSDSRPEGGPDRDDSARPDREPLLKGFRLR